jgi:hypothetical protein
MGNNNDELLFMNGIKPLKAHTYFGTEFPASLQYDSQSTLRSVSSLCGSRPARGYPHH